jgi:hypothetical protein
MVARAGAVVFVASPLLGFRLDFLGANLLLVHRDESVSLAHGLFESSSSDAKDASDVCKVLSEVWAQLCENNLSGAGFASMNHENATQLIPDQESKPDTKAD